MYGNKIVIMNKVISLIMGIYKVFSTRHNKEMVMIILQNNPRSKTRRIVFATH